MKKELKQEGINLKNNSKMRIVKNSKGITLIALVITIIVLLILASVSIAMLTGDNGILTQANKAKHKTGVKGLKEEVTLMMQKRKIDESTGQKVALKEDLEKEISGNKVIEEIEGIAEACYVTKDNETVTVYEDGTVAEGKAIWDGVSKLKPTVDSEGNWHIKTPEEFKYFADFVNGKLSEEEKAGLSIGETTIVNLENHIDLGARQENGTKTRGTNWNSIGKTKEAMFSGIFEGNNNIIRGIYIDEIENFTGLFGVGREVKNLTLKDSYITGGSCIGGIVGMANIIENCHNENTAVISKEGNYWAIGGIVGQINNKIINCSNTGTIIANGKKTDNGHSYCGGVIGQSSSKNEVIISNCINKGKITGEGNLVGGIIGNCVKGTMLEKSENSGKVTGKGERVGGIAGNLSTSTIKECKNSGEIIGENQYTGGIAGINFGNIEKSENQGKVTGKREKVGGITGNNNYASSSTIKECKNSGEIIGEDSQVGGISGINFGNIEKSENSGKVIGKGARVGGITGDTGTNAIIKECKNAGEIIGEKLYTGGITGANYGVIERSENKGKITGKNISVGGIVGLSGGGEDASIINCYNTGEIMGESGAGGIIGYITSNMKDAIIKNNYNIGKVVSSGKTGGIIGKNDFANTIIENNYYLNGTAKTGVGYSDKDIEGKTERKEEQEMKTEEFGNILNAGQEPAVWKGINGAYPELII